MIEKFIIMKTSTPCSVDSVPLSFAKKFEKRAAMNHGQTIERLNERGGLSPIEFYCIAHDLSIKKIFTGEATVDMAVGFLEEYQKENEEIIKVGLLSLGDIIESGEYSKGETYMSFTGNESIKKAFDALGIPFKSVCDLILLSKESYNEVVEISKTKNY